MFTGTRHWTVTWARRIQSTPSHSINQLHGGESFLKSW